MNFKFYLLILFVFSFINSDPEFKLEKELNIKADLISVDQNGNMYIGNGSEIIKIDLNKNLKQSYSNSLLGNVTSIDASDPFQILVFYKDFNKVVFLNNNLTEITSPVHLDNIGFYRVSAVCQSVSGGFWIIDQNQNQLISLSKSLSVINKSSRIQEFLDQKGIQKPVFMLEKNDYIYVGIKGDGVLLFDTYGTYIKIFPIKEIDDFQMINETIYYFYNDKMYMYNTNSFTKKEFVLPVQNAKNAKIVNKRILISTEKSIYVYQIINF